MQYPKTRLNRKPKVAVGHQDVAEEEGRVDSGVKDGSPTPDPLERLGEIKTVSEAHHWLKKAALHPPEVQAKIHEHIKERFPDLLVHRRRLP